MCTAIIQVQNLRKYFRKTGTLIQTLRSKPEFIKAVDDVTFEIARGEVLGLVGESGSGKTTLGRAVLRLEEPESGRIYFEGQDFTAIKDRSVLKDFRRKMQMIFQDPFDSINPRLKVKHVVEEPLRVHKIGANKTERIQLIKRTLEEV